MTRPFLGGEAWKTGEPSFIWTSCLINLARPDRATVSSSWRRWNALLAKREITQQ